MSHITEQKDKSAIPLEIHEQEEYLNLQAQFISLVTVETDLVEIKQREALEANTFDDEQEAY